MRNNLSRRNDFFNNFFSTFYDDREMSCDWTPAVDIVDKNNSYLINVDVPGVRKEDISIEIKDSYLTIKGERKYEYNEENDNVYKSERCFGNFSRSFNIENVEEENIKANFENGTLKIELPKKQEKQPKKIQLN